MENGETAMRFAAAINLIRRVPGYEPVAQELQELYGQDKLRFDPSLEDRGQTALNGAIRIGPEAMGESAVSLAATPVHENYHRHQSPLLKTVSFWTGIVTRNDTMQQYEAPAYNAAAQFLEVLAVAVPEVALEARNEAEAGRAAFATFYTKDGTRQV